MNLREATTNAFIIRAAATGPDARFADLFKLVRRSVAVESSGEYREIGIRSFGKGIFHKPPVSGYELGAKRVFEIRDGDLVVSNVFGWEGAVAVARAKENGMIGSHRFMTWVTRTPDVQADWVARYLTTPEGMERLQRASPGSAGRNRTLAISRLQDVRVKTPAADEQRAVLRWTQILDRAKLVRSRSAAMADALTPAALNHYFAGLR